jgi:hypothetical protein
VVHKGRQKPDGSGFPLEKTTSNFRHAQTVLRLLARLFSKSDPRRGDWAPRGRHDRDFVGYLVTSNRKTIDTRWQDLGATLRRLLWRLLVAALACGLLWIVWESARALHIF